MKSIYSKNSFHAYHIQNTADVTNFVQQIVKLETTSGSFFADYLRNLLPLTFVLEENYVDKDWTSLLSLHYSEVYGQHPRFVKRIHIFSGLIGGKTVVLGGVRSNDSYLGYFTVYPTRPRTLGRSHFNARRMGFTCGLMECTEIVHVAGRELEVNGFPFCGQDMKVIRCAHVAIWEVMRYYSTKYGYYGEHYLGDIAKLSEDSRFGRSIPSKGLNVLQIPYVFGGLRLRPAIYSKKEFPDLIRIAKGYIFSGIPVVLINNKHAVVGTGLVERNDINSDIVVNDDNWLPCLQISDDPTRQSKSSVTPSNIESIFVPLYSKIVLPLENAEKWAITWAGSSIYGLIAGGVPTPTYYRVYLVSSKSYKKSIRNRQHQTSYDHTVCTVPLPKFVWLAEFSLHSDFRTISAEYVLDATTSIYDGFPFLLIRYPSVFLYNSRFSASDRNSYDIEPVTNPHLEWETFPGNLQ